MAEKDKKDTGSGFEVPRESINPILFDMQIDIVLWCLKKGRVLVGLDCGFGKGPIQLEWLYQIHKRENRPVIMLAPPGVKTQFKAVEAPKFGYEVNIANEQSDIVNGINITNYERLMKRETIEVYKKEVYFKRFAHCHPVEIKRNTVGEEDEHGRLIEKGTIQIERFRFDPRQFVAIALDEASILKHYGAKTRERLTRFAESIPFRICATATPAPNDIYELGSYAEFLGIMRSRQIKAKYFIQDGNTSTKFRLMKPAIEKWWEFVAGWAIIVMKPSDLGYSDEGYELPGLEEVKHILKDTTPSPGMLIPMPAKTLQDTERIKKKTVKERCKMVAEIANADNDHKLIFIRRNNEGILLNKLIPGSVEVAGRHSEEIKEKRLMGFAQGKYKILITKPKIGGFGLNLQEHCHRVISGNINYSNEEKYQYVRRVWRYGQVKDVKHDMITMDTEGDILYKLDQKEKGTQDMIKEVVKRMDIHDLNRSGRVKKDKSGYEEAEHFSEYWKLYLGDSCTRVLELEDQSLDTIMTSVPFPAMYAYTNFDQDIGNYETAEELCEHLKYVFARLLPKMKPGAISHIHIAQGVAFQNRHGYQGLWDFRGPLVKMMQEVGWEFYSEITIEKDPQTQAARNHSHPLMQKTVFTDAAALGASVPDYLILFKAPGEKEKVTALLSDPAIQGKYNSPDGWITMDMWINWASNVWLMHRKGMKWWEGINVTKVLGALLNNKTGERNGFGIRAARDEEDEKHLCELQLDIIERCVAIHTKPGDLVCDPFNGIASVGFQSLLMGRRYVGFELKKSYWLTAIKNLEYCEHKIKQQKFDLFSMNNIDVEGGDVMIIRHKQWMQGRGISLNDRATKWHDWEIKEPQAEKLEQVGMGI
jgi:DNA modification methylase